jgi:hypothetical protein
MYPWLQQQALKVLKMDSTMPYGRKLQMAKLLGVDLDGTADPNFIMAMQAVYASKPRNPNKPAKHRKANLKSTAMSSMTLQSRTSGPTDLH